MTKISAKLCLALCVVVFYITLSLAKKRNICTEIGRSCETDCNCCSGCCKHGICLKSCDEEDNPCSTVECPEPEVCVLEQVTCIKAPCNPVPVCKPKPSGIKDPCSTVLCESGSHCEVRQVFCIRAPCPPVARCIPDGTALTDPCAVVRCQSGYHCMADCSIAPCRGRCVLDVQANPCMTVKCSAGHHCEPSVCMKAPCPPATGQCVPDVNPCATALCQDSTVCVVQPGTNEVSCVPTHD